MDSRLLTVLGICENLPHDNFTEVKLLAIMCDDWMFLSEAAQQTALWQLCDHLLERCVIVSHSVRGE